MTNITQTGFKPKWYHVILVRYLLIIVIVITVIAFLSEYLFIIKPKMDQTSAGGLLDVGVYEQIFLEQKQYLEKLQKLQEESEKIDRAELEKLNFVIAGKLDMPAVLRQLETLAAQTDMTLIGLGVSADKGEKGKAKGTVIMSLSFTGGDYRVIKEYLSAIEKNIRIMDVTNLSMREVGNLFSLTVKSYYIE